jgi:hypothetical protein
MKRTERDDDMELTRFRGYLSTWVEEGVHDAQESLSVPAGTAPAVG